MRSVTIALCALFLFCANITQAVAQKKVALVIGNGRYIGQVQLDNPVRNAKAIGDVLKNIGFTLVGQRAQADLDRPTMERLVREFATEAQDADIALFFYSGHGVQIGGANYLLPTDLIAYTPATVDKVTISANFILDSLNQSQARLKLLLLDACRDNPFVLSRNRFGLAGMDDPPSGTVIGFATRPGSGASQGRAGELSPYANALRTYLGVSGLELFAMLNDVGQTVMSDTNNQQQPTIFASSIAGRVHLNPSNVPPPPIPSAPRYEGVATPTPTPVSPSQGSNGASLAFIQEAKKQFHESAYAEARATLSKGIDVDPNSALPYSYRGYAWFREGLTQDPQSAILTYRKAFQDLDNAIALDPGYAPVRRHRGNTILAVYKALRAQGKPTNNILDNAIADFKAAITLDPTSKTNANALGNAYLVKGSYADAIDNFNKAIRRDDSYAAPYAGLCAAHLALGNLSTARTNAQRAAALDSDHQSMPCLRKSILEFIPLA
jgi:uncharacterized caspase-like protein